ncbi:EscU/YscU/HrcU family type III secretion system export apparatus switch protein [Alteribacillus iranensis]|uniref:Flagellar biosynthesis protein n=1 Tax=Alteribacillus iranensis TaxID=930128 RepID=A0A1I1ZJG9_9BACI|nr:EscU/YscU/HrcU family type III secretion system export apparatus switch protein [Alteribacillus iranensis]SFE31851.1 flagellar biosynthesis protein [Alteribacillus iranensis]
MRITHHYNQKQRREKNGPRAAAVKYEDGETPTVTAQGTGEVAQNIISLAEENGIHMQKDASLAASLLDMDLGESVPPQLYSVIAEVLLLIEEMEEEL